MRNILSYSLLLVLVTILGCELERVNPYDPENPDGNAEILPPPGNVQTIDGDKVIVLTWDSVPGANGYQVYRDDVRIADTDTTYYMNSGLAYKTYEYQVATVHSSGLGGHKSAPVTGESKEGPKIPNVVFSRFEVYSGGNGDDEVNRGEELNVDIYLKNIGSGKANDVKASIQEDDPYMIVTDDEAEYNDMDPLEESKEYASYTNWSFKVSEDCPYDHTVTFFLNISDSEGNSWLDTFTVVVLRTKANIEFYQFEVYSGGNGDDEVNRGEELNVDIYLVNSGSSKANDVEASLSVNDSYIVLVDDEADYNDLDPFEKTKEYASYTNWSFKVSEDCPYSHMVTFFLSISDSEGNTWLDTFNVEVVQTKANIEFSRFEVYSGGNGDNHVNPGEDLNVDIYLENTGVSKAVGVKATLSEDDPYITITDADAEYNDMDPFEETKEYASYTNWSFEVSETAPVGHTINFSLDIQDEHGNSWDDSFTVTVE